MYDIRRRYCFIDNLETVWNGISSLFKHSYDYNVCFISLSKYGCRQPLDDVLSISRQPCTTASAYILQKSTATILYDTVNEGLYRMKETGDFHTNCIDRYWSKLDGLVFLKTKIAFQRPSWSSTRNEVVQFLD